MDQPTEVSSARSALEVLLSRISKHAQHPLRGAFQFNAKRDEGGADHYFFEFGEHGGPAALQVGTHPAPDVTLSAPSRLLVDMLQMRFDFRNPESIAQLAIEGDGGRLVALTLYIVDLSPALAAFERSAGITRSAPIREVPRVERPSQDYIVDALARRQPVIITGAMKAWGWRCHDWDLARLREELGDAVVTLKGAKNVVLRDFIDLIATTNGKDLKTGGCALPKSSVEVLDPPGYFTPADFMKPLAFLGAGGSITRIHRDPQHVFAAHIFGRKRWLLFSPDQGELVYANEGGSEMLCAVDPDAENHDAHPRFKEARPIDVTLEAGEILVNPSGWFHHVYTLDAPSLNLAFELRDGRVP